MLGLVQAIQMLLYVLRPCLMKLCDIMRLETKE